MVMEFSVVARRIAHKMVFVKKRRSLFGKSQAFIQKDLTIHICHFLLDCAIFVLRWTVFLGITLCKPNAALECAQNDSPHVDVSW